MKKRNLLVPLATLVAATTPTIAITSCTMENSKPQTLNINKDGILLGFKKGTTKAKIKKQFGNTMMIPKEVTYIAPYAFVNVPKQETTIPDFIENFVFEEGYKCEKIGEMTFAYAPFKSVKIENERQEGIDPENPDKTTFNWSRPFDEATGQYTGWGLKTIDQYAFYKTEKLEYLKLCASITSLQTRERRSPIIGWEAEQGVATTDWTSNLKTLDLSDYNFSTDAAAPRKDILPAQIAWHLMIDMIGDTQHYDSNCHVIYRFLDGVNNSDPIRTIGQDSEVLQDKNMVRNDLGMAAEGVAQSDSCGLWTLMPAHKMVDHLVEEEDIGKCLSTYYGGNYVTNQWNTHYTFDVDLSKWSGKLPKLWKVFVMDFDKNQGSIANNTELKLWLNEQDDEHLLDPTIDYSFADGVINGIKPLRKTDKLIVQFSIASNINKACTYFAKR